MKTLTFLIFLFPFVFMTGCQKDSTPNNTIDSFTYDVSGRIMANSIPLMNVEVDIDELEQYKTVTDEEGRFVIKNVSRGEHELNAVHKNNDQSYTQSSFDIDVNSDLLLDSLPLPNPVVITYDLDSLTNVVSIRWNRSLAEDFREYKLYSHSTSGLDENTGELVHVATDVNDTIKEIQLESNTLIYFRVFVMNDFGKLGGSNIINISSSFINLLTYGDLEDPEGFFSTWNIIQGNGNIYIVDSNQYAGNYCLLFQSTNDTVTGAHGSCVISHPQILLEQNKEYELSFWYKWKKGISADMYPLFFYYKQDNQYYLNEIITPPGEYVDYAWIIIEEDLEWTYYSITFYPNSASSVQFFFEGNINELYFDNIQLKKVM